MEKPSSKPSTAQTVGGSIPKSNPALPPTGEILVHQETVAGAAEEVANAAPPPNVEAINATKKRAEQKEAEAAAKPPQNKGGRPKGSIPWNKRDQTAASSRLGVNQPKPGYPLVLDELTKAKCRMAGRGSADAFMLIARTLGGPEWAPDKPVAVNGQMIDEAENLRQAWAQTYEFYGWCNTPGWFPMVFSGVGYAAVRLNRPETAKRVLSFKEKIAAWWAKRAVRAMDAESKANRPEKG